MFYYFLAGLLGLLFQTLANMNSLKKEFTNANQDFLYKKFLKCEMLSILMSIVAILICAVTLPDILAFKPELEKFCRLLFATCGAIGSWAINQLLGKSKKHILGIIDKKTNIADADPPYHF